MKSLISLALALTVLPAVHAVATAPPPPPEGAPPEAAVALSGSPAPAEDLAARVELLARRADAHARRLGLAVAGAPPGPADPRALAREEARLEAVVGFLAGNREAGVPVDERSRPAASPRGRTPGARLRHAHSLVVRRALALGLAQPGALRPAPTPEGRRDQLDRWEAIADWLAARDERVRPTERPLSARIEHYDELTCIAGHEAGPEHGGWQANTGNGYYGGLQMDRGFQQTYAPGLYREKGTADNWTREEQMRAAERAIPTRGFTPWPNTARMCGLL